MVWSTTIATCLTISRDGDVAAAGFADGNFALFQTRPTVSCLFALANDSTDLNATAGGPIKIIDYLSKSSLVAIVISKPLLRPESEGSATTSRDVQLWDVSAGHRAAVLRVPGVQGAGSFEAEAIVAVKLTAARLCIFVDAPSCEVAIFDLTTLQLLHRLKRAVVPLPSPPVDCSALCCNTAARSLAAVGAVSEAFLAVPVAVFGVEIREASAQSPEPSPRGPAAPTTRGGCGGNIAEAAIDQPTWISPASSLLTTNEATVSCAASAAGGYPRGEDDSDAADIGAVAVVDLGPEIQPVASVIAANTPITALSFNASGRVLATASATTLATCTINTTRIWQQRKIDAARLSSQGLGRRTQLAELKDKGTLLRLWSMPDLDLIATFRRGMTRATILNLRFVDPYLLSVSTQRVGAGTCNDDPLPQVQMHTVHAFSIPPNREEELRELRPTFDNARGAVSSCKARPIDAGKWRSMLRKAVVKRLPSKVRENLFETSASAFRAQLRASPLPSDCDPVVLECCASRVRGVIQMRVMMNNGLVGTYRTRGGLNRPPAPALSLQRTASATLISEDHIAFNALSGREGGHQNCDRL